MPLFMLDTDISSYIMKRTFDTVLRKLETVAPSEVCISSITKCELLYGIEASPRKAQDQAALELFLRYMAVEDFSGEAAFDYGRFRADLKLRGEMIGANDLLIAAHAHCLGLTLVTNNTREFGRVRGLKLENWV